MTANGIEVRTAKYIVERADKDGAVFVMDPLGRIEWCMDSAAAADWIGTQEKREASGPGAVMRVAQVEWRDGLTPPAEVRS